MNDDVCEGCGVPLWWHEEHEVFYDRDFSTHCSAVGHDYHEPV